MHLGSALDGSAYVIEAALVKAWASLSHVKAELMLARREEVIALSYLFVHLGEVERKTFMTN
jgi:hypothetical protein